MPSPCASVPLASLPYFYLGIKSRYTQFGEYEHATASYTKDFQILRELYMRRGGGGGGV